MSAHDDEAVAWRVRSFVYGHLVEQGRPPTVAEAAVGLHLDPAAVRQAYRWLHERHALFLRPDGERVRMAHPFSGVPTPFRVEANGRRYFANCAWDALGIPAALHADATIDATYAEDGTPARLTVGAGRIGGDTGVVHFLVPFRAWYDDLVFT